VEARDRSRVGVPVPLHRYWTFHPVQIAFLSDLRVERIANDEGWRRHGRVRNPPVKSSSLLMWRFKKQWSVPFDEMEVDDPTDPPMPVAADYSDSEMSEEEERIPDPVDYESDGDYEESGKQI